MVLPGNNPPVRDSSTIRFTGKETVNETVSFVRPNGFWMDLNPMNLETWMAQSHDEAGRCFCGVDQQCVLPVVDGHQRVVPGEFHR